MPSNCFRSLQIPKMRRFAMVMSDIFRPGNLRKCFSFAPQKSFLILSRRLTFMILVVSSLFLTGLWMSWIRNNCNWYWLSAFQPADIVWRQAWVKYPNGRNDTGELLSQFRNHALSQCRDVETKFILTSLPAAESGSPIRVLSGSIHRMFITSLNERGEPLCEGGDYYEADLSGQRWKSRPPVMDLGNGTYEIQLQVDERFSGLYILKVILLYSRFNGLELVPQFYREEEMAVFELLFESSNTTLDKTSLRDPSICGNGDYDLSRWSGRWTRSQRNDSCVINAGGRYQCLQPRTECEIPWCEGPLDRLDSNGWVYSAHCRFKLFTADEAWDCLDKKWLFSWGDSTSQHTWQNLLAFVMDYDDISAVNVSRRMDSTWVRPGPGANSSARQSLRLTMVYNGHANEEGMFQGLESLKVPQFREFLTAFFVNKSSPAYSPPDVLVMNSGLHDAFFYRDPEHFFRDGISTAVTFWKEILDAIQPHQPRIVYRTSVATAGKARAKEYNPQKMEVYNRLFVDNLQNMNISGFRILDGFDLTFPWHYDNNYSDGTHYGLKPELGLPGHQYFVDHMFAHMLLNSICPL